MSYLKDLLSAEEEVLFLTHRHWTAFLGQIWVTLLLLIAACAIAVAVNLLLLPGGNQALGSSLQSLPGEQQLLVRVGLFFVLAIVPLTTLIARYWRWKAEQFVVTNLRVIQLQGILSKRVLDSSLEKVNDVMLVQSLMGRILNYGDLEILTASELAVNKLGRISAPLAFKAAMLNAKHDLEQAPRLSN